MFEKEAEELFKKKPLGYEMKPEIEIYKDGFKDGYNKAKEEADKMKSRFLELCNLKDMRIKELEKANEWHYPSKGELPEKTGRYLILNRFGEHYFTTNITEYLEGAKLFSCFSMKDVYAWKEIILPELPKESE